MIKMADMKDAEVLAAMAIQMWAEHDPEDMADEFCKLVMNEEAVCFLKYVDSRPIAFAFGI